MGFMHSPHCKSPLPTDRLGARELPGTQDYLLFISGKVSYCNMLTGFYNHQHIYDTLGKQYFITGLGLGLLCGACVQC